MKLSVLLPPLLATVGSALPRQRRSTPCPYDKAGSESGTLVEDGYIVQLSPGYTHEGHYEFVGFNLSARATDFNSMPFLDMYSLTIDEYTMHNIIRYDPGVSRVTHNMISYNEVPWYKTHRSANDGKKDGLLKRWSHWGGIFHYSTGHINQWDRAYNRMNEWYHTVCAGPTFVYKDDD